MTSRAVRPSFEACRAENRSALIGYLPTGYPDVADLDLGDDGAWSNPVATSSKSASPTPIPGWTGPTIAAATEVALRGGVRVRDALTAVEAISNAGGRAVVMTYWNPVLQLGRRRVRARPGRRRADSG